MLDKDAFMRRYQRQHKDREWARDVLSYSRWKAIAEKYNSEYAKERMAILEAKYPGKL